MGWPLEWLFFICWLKLNNTQLLAFFVVYNYRRILLVRAHLALKDEFLAVIFKKWTAYIRFSFNLLGLLLR